MNSLGQTPAQWEDAYTDATTWFLELAEHAVTHLNRTALGEWSVRDLLGHTSRAWITVSTYLTAPDGTLWPTMTTADYFVDALATADAVDIAERGRSAGAQLGDDVLAALHRAAQDARKAVAAAPPTWLAATPFGQLAIGEYLPTRTFELTVHGCDLAHTIAQPPLPPPSAATSALRVLADLTERRGVTAQVINALTGRAPLPSAFSLL